MNNLFPRQHWRQQKTNHRGYRQHRNNYPRNRGMPFSLLVIHPVVEIRMSYAQEISSIVCENLFIFNLFSPSRIQKKVSNSHYRIHNDILAKIQ